ncbi:MAG: hypothetical protein ACJAT2_001597 [Bacteriovoracaceae bacterium]|jgi:hypothetical protein
MFSINPSFAGFTDPGSFDVKAAFTELNQEPSDPIVLANIPKALILEEAKKAILAEGTTIVEVHRLDLDPTNRLVIFEGVTELPADVLADMNEIGGIEASDVTLSRHKFSIHFELPSAKKLALTRYFQITIRSLKIGGQDYTNATHVLGQFAVGLMLNTSFMDYMLEVKPEVQVSDENPSLMIKQLIENKGLRFRGNTIAFKLDLTMIPQLAAYKDLEGLRVWGVTPTILRGTNGQSALRIEAGIGRPNSAWIKESDKRHNDDEENLMSAREELYAEYSRTDVLMQDLEHYISEMAGTLGLSKFNIRQGEEYNSLSGKIKTKAREILSKKDVSFVADPELTYELFKESAKEMVSASLSDLKRRQLIDEAMYTGGSNTNALPFLEKRLSQKTLDEASRFFREFEFEGDQMFPELAVVLDPKNAGIILRGRVAIDINMLMAMGMEGSGIEFSKIPLRVADDQWGTGIPFQVGLRINMLKDSVLGLDVHHLRLFDGSQSIHMYNDSDHSSILINYMKMAITQTLLTTLIEQPIADTPVEGEEVEAYDSYKEIISNIKKQNGVYDTAGSDALDSILQIAKIDIENNPFILEGKKYVAGKTELFFKKLIRYDEKSKLLKINLDPRIASEKIMNSDNNIQVWNLEPLYDKVMNKTYLELAVGNKRRSEKYENHLELRPENKDSQRFVGVDGTKKQSPRDLHVKMNLQHFENLINQIFKDAFLVQNAAVEKALKKEQEVDQYLVKNINLNVIRDGELRLNMVLSHIKKGKKFFFNPSRIWSSSYKEPAIKTISASMSLQLSVEELSKYKENLEYAENEIFLGDELLRLDISKVGLKFEGNTSVLDKIIGLMAKDIDFKNSGLAKKLKIFLLKFAGKFMNESDPSKNGNLELGGVKINKYVKMFTHNEEILLQLNPHAMANAFDVKLIPNQKFNGADLGLVVKKSDNSIAFDFSTTGSMASVDKGELTQIIESAIKIFKPYNEAKTAKELKLLLTGNSLFDKVFYNSDYAKASLLHRFRRLLSQYNGMIDIIGLDADVVDQVNRNLNRNFTVENGSFNSRSITNSGVEIMYFLSTAIVIQRQLVKLIQKLEEFELMDYGYADDLVAQKDKLDKNYIESLVRLYAEKFDKHNKRIIKKGPTDWNHTYFPDARYSNEVFERINKFFR